MITYDTNWMGPINGEWIRKHGNTWAGGRIDIRGVPDEPYGLEYGLNIMQREDWGRFTAWLDDLETQELWTLQELLDTYERTNPPIRWFQE
jgi:hypothetical protein